MTTQNHNAAISNPALQPFSMFVGEWKTVGTHPKLPDTTLHGHTSFNWIEAGAFVIMHSKLMKEKFLPALQFLAATILKTSIYALLR